MNGFVILTIYFSSPIGLSQTLKLEIKLRLLVEDGNESFNFKQDDGCEVNQFVLGKH